MVESSSVSTAARKAILQNVRRSLNRIGPLEPSIANALEQRLQQPANYVRPDFDDDLVERFVQKHTAVNGGITRIANISELPDAIKNCLKESGGVTEFVCANVAPLHNMTWPNELTVHYREAHKDDVATLNMANCAVAETGTLVFGSCKDKPATLNFLPDDHIVLLRTGDIVKNFEDIWTRVKTSDNDLPRAVNLVTGPSKTADVEQTLVYGAHGPKRLHVILLSS